MPCPGAGEIGVQALSANAGIGDNRRHTGAGMDTLDYWELASYVVTVVGLPLAIAVFIYEQRRERDNEEEEEYQLLARRLRRPVD